MNALLMAYMLIGTLLIFAPVLLVIYLIDEWSNDDDLS